MLWVGSVHVDMFDTRAYIHLWAQPYYIRAYLLSARHRQTTSFALRNSSIESTKFILVSSISTVYVNSGITRWLMWVKPLPVSTSTWVRRQGWRSAMDSSQSLISGNSIWPAFQSSGITAWGTVLTGTAGRTGAGAGASGWAAAEISAMKAKRPAGLPNGAAAGAGAGTGAGAGAAGWVADLT